MLLCKTVSKLWNSYLNLLSFRILWISSVWRSARRKYTRWSGDMFYCSSQSLWECVQLFLDFSTKEKRTYWHSCMALFSWYGLALQWSMCQHWTKILTGEWMDRWRAQKQWFLLSSRADRHKSMSCLRKRWLLFLKVSPNSCMGLQPCQCCDLETMVSRLECTRVHFVQVSVSRPDSQGLGLGLENWRPRSRSWSRDLKTQISVSVSRPDGPGLSRGLETWRPRSRSWSQDSMLGASPVARLPYIICSTFKRVLCHQLELMQPVMWLRDHGLETWVHSSSFWLGLDLETWWPRSWSWSRDLKTKVSVLVSRPDGW